MSRVLIAASPAASAVSRNLIHRTPLLSGDAGIQQTIDVMRSLVDDASADPSIVRLATDIVKTVPAYQERAEAEAIYKWVRGNIRFTRDPLTKEKLYPPGELLKIRAGDCDDMATLIAALDFAVGIPARFVTVAGNRSYPQEFSHVYTEAEVPAGSGNWIPQDAARFESRFGSEPPRYFRKRAWNIADSTTQDLGRLGAYTEVQPLKYIGRRYGLGDDSSIDTGAIISQSLQEIPAIISTIQGGGSAVQTPQGMVSTYGNNPYGSFITPGTPGYGIPPAGYGYGATVSSNSLLPWLIGGALLLFLARGRF